MESSQAMTVSPSTAETVFTVSWAGMLGGSARRGGIRFLTLVGNPLNLPSGPNALPSYGFRRIDLIATIPLDS